LIQDFFAATFQSEGDPDILLHCITETCQQHLYRKAAYETMLVTKMASPALESEAVKPELVKPEIVLA